MSHRSTTPRPWRVVQVLTTRGRLTVIVCSLCGALVAAAGEDRHDAVHRAQLREEDEG